MKKLALGLLALIAALLCVNSQNLPAVGPGDYLVTPGSYVMTGNMVFNVNDTGLIAGDCGMAQEPCVTIDTQGFSFSLQSLNATAPLHISGIRFTNTLLTGTAALNLSSPIGPLSLEKVTFENASTVFIFGLPPASLSISNSVFSNNNVSRLIEIFPLADDLVFPIMGSLEMSNLLFENNLPEFPTVNDALVYIQVQIIDLINIEDCIFDNNAGILRIGDSLGILVSDGVSELRIVRSTFRNHQEITGEITIGGPIVSLPLIWQRTTSRGPAWIFSENTVTGNSATIISVVFVDSILYEGNSFIDNPTAKLLDGNIQLGAVFKNNVYLRSGHFAIHADPSATSSNVTFQNEDFDFQLTAVESKLIQIFDFKLLVLSSNQYHNIFPGNISNSPAVIYVERVNTVTITDCSFSNISFSNVPASTHAGCLMAGYTDIIATTISMTTSGVTFDEYPVEDAVTADFVALASQGRTGVLQLASSPLSSLFNVSRIATTTDVIIRSPAEIRTSIVNRADFGTGAVTLQSNLYVRTAVELMGRIQLYLGPRVDFYWTPQRNGSIQAHWVPTYIPRIVPTATTRYAVDLGDGLSVPANSRYILITQARADLPAQTAVIPIWQGRTSKPGFSGRLVAGNSTTVGSETVNEVTMIATPLCSVACVVGDCNHREYCTCSNGWTGTACTCLTDGRPAGVGCSNSTTNFEWVADTPQSLASGSTLLIPRQLAFIIDSDMQVDGELRLTSTSKLFVKGRLSVSGKIIVENEAEGYPYSCDFYMPTQVTVGSLQSTTTSSFEVIALMSNVASCPSKRDAQSLSETGRSLQRDSMDYASDNYDALIVVNQSAQMAGSLTVDATGITVKAGKQQQAKILATNSSSQIDLLTVTVNTQPTICSTVDKAPLLVSAVFTVCNGEKRKVQWWWYGVPIIAIVVVLIVITIVILSVPSYRRAILPYSAK